MNKEEVQQIFVEDIIPNRFQPRLTFDEKALKELSDSIKVHGVIQPLVLRKVGNKYEIIAGERRYKASCMAGLKQVPAIVREMSDNDSAEIALIENVQRKNLTSIEEARSYRNLLDRGYLTQEELANKLGVSQSTIANKLRLLNLCEEVQNALLNEQISERHARSLLAIDNPDDQKKLLDKIIKERLTVSKLDGLIKRIKAGEGVDEVIVSKPSNEVVEMNNQVNQVMNNQNPVMNNAMPGQNDFGVETFVPNDAANQTNMQYNAPMQNAYNPFTQGQMAGNVQMPNNMQFNNPMGTATAPQMQPDFNAPSANVDMMGAPGQMMNTQPPMMDNTNQVMNQPMNPNPYMNQQADPFNNNNNILFNQTPEYISPQGQMTNPGGVNAPLDYDPTINNMNPMNMNNPVAPGEQSVETFNMFGDVIDPNSIRDAEDEAPRNELNIGDQINFVREVVENIKTNGFEVDTEEFDLNDVYQITIKISKPNKEESN